MTLRIEGEIPTALSGPDLADLLRDAVDRVEGTGGATGEPESVAALRALADLVARGRTDSPAQWGDEGLDAQLELELEDGEDPPCPDCGARRGDDHRDDCFGGG